MRTKPTLCTLLALVSLCANLNVYSQAANNTCTNATMLIPGISCAPVSGSLQKATSASTDGSVSGSCGGATAGTTFDVWYKFSASSSSTTLNVSNLGGGLTGAYTPYLEVMDGNCGSFTSILCQSIGSGLTTTLTSLTVGTTYYIRVFTTSQGSSNPSKNWSFDICLTSSPNDDCFSGSTLVPANTCNAITGTLDLATPSTGLPAGCESAGTHYDVWYSFVASSTVHSVKLGALANISSPEIQLYSGSCGALTSLQCGTTSLTATGLTIGNTYYVRVSNIGSSPTNSSFNICVTTPPANDECTGAIELFSNTTCTNTTSSLVSATPSAGIPVGCASAGTYYDVWFSFAAANSSETVTTNLPAGSAIQLYSGSCGALTSVACGTTSLTATGLTVGATYYVRASSVNTEVSSGTFRICLTHPAPVVSSIDYGKSYVNISKNSDGGTISPGDTLEVRGTLVIRGGSGLDSLAFLDTLSLGGGVRLVPGSISLRTNEGVVYNSFTDAVNDDAGYYYTSGTDTVIRINFGAGASASSRGKLTNTSRPSVFGSTCIIMATYRVVVYADYGTTLNLGGGKITTKDVASGSLNDLSFGSRNAIVYSSPGLCPNAVAASNAIGGDGNGTFGSGTSQNRSASPNVIGYTYATFAQSNPQDYYYGIANNTSAGGTGFTTTTTWAKPDNSSPTHRVFNVWDITGDHTGAADPAKGNPPCDPTQPVSPTNPCGYMLVVNSAYKTDTAFQYTVSNLCQNTYYEISAWFKNMCYKCGCDSTGTGVSGATYIPSGPNDSSGVKPNLTFDINGIDYYTTGNIRYAGLYPSTQTGSDSNNTWVKRGFTYLTGPGQTSLTLTIRNNAPGGGGNDWAMDDISLATCLPNMQYSPSLSPTTCNNNALAINDTIRSYFSNYSYFKWQKSTDAGTTWTDIASADGTAVPSWNGDAYEYVTSYEIPPTETSVSNTGDKYRVVVATTAGNLANSDCQFTDGISIIGLNVLDCGNPPPLDTYILSFNGTNENGYAKLNWTTKREDEPTEYIIEKSADAFSFRKVGSVKSGYAPSQVSAYTFKDPEPLTSAFYRISATTTNGRNKVSRTIHLKNSFDEFAVSNVTTYFGSAVSFDVSISQTSKVDVSIFNTAGNFIAQKSFSASKGTNSFTIPNLDALVPGLYVMQVRSNGRFVHLKIIKR